MRLITVRIYCPRCGDPRDVTRRVRLKTCAGCRKTEDRLTSLKILAAKVADQVPTKMSVPKVLDVLLALDRVRANAKAQKQRLKAGRP